MSTTPPPVSATAAALRYIETVESPDPARAPVSLELAGRGTQAPKRPSVA